MAEKPTWLIEIGLGRKCDKNSDWVCFVSRINRCWVHEKIVSDTSKREKMCWHVDTMVNKVEGLEFLAISLVDNFDCKLTGGISFHV